MARADLAARQLLDQLGCVKPPVHPQKIAELLGALVVDTEMSPTLSGMLVREPGRLLVGVNKSHHERRKRFTIAHELGHLRLHKGRALIMDSDVRVNLRDSVSSLATDREEIEANRFAAALLMPEHMVRSEIGCESFSTARQLVERLSGAFEVSATAMNYRLVNLGVIPTPVELAHD